jgi:hypothetical protein
MCIIAYKPHSVKIMDKPVLEAAGSLIQMERGWLGMIWKQIHGKLERGT